MSFLGLLACVIWLNGGGYLFAWPLLLGLIAIPFLQAQRQTSFASLMRLTGSTLTMATSLFLFVPVIYLITVALSIRAGFIAAGIAAFALAMMTLPLQQIAPRRPWIVSVIAAVAAVVLLGAGAMIG